jgi:ketosteroid isomerase-like protein
MRIAFRVLACLSLFVAAPRYGAAQDTTAVAAVRVLMERLRTAVERQDGRQMASVYVAEDPLVFSSHTVHLARRDSLLAIYLAWDSTRTRGTYLRFTELKYQPLGPDAILVTGRLQLARGTATGTAPDTSNGTWTGVFERRRGRWGLAHEHESFGPRR